jgi:hypothetical protein
MNLINMNLRKELIDLNYKVSDTFTKLRESKDEYIFYTEEDIQNDDHTEHIFEAMFRSDRCDVHIIKVNKNGIYAISSESGTKDYIIEFNDLMDISDRITLVELMKEQLAKHLINQL